LDFQDKGSVEVFMFLGKAILVFFAGAVVFHMVVMVIDYFLMVKPFYMDLRDNFASSLFSEPMMPMMGAYGILSLGIYLLWEKTKKAVLLVREKEFQRENVEAVLKSMQHLTGIMAEHIASHNSEIMSWVEFRKKQGRPVSQKVESSNKKIAIAIQSLSEMSFVYPYAENRPRNLSDIEKELQNKLSDASR
jgi:hypothetical protein